MPKNDNLEKAKYSLEAVLEAVIESGSLGKSKRQAKLLEYLLRENQAGRIDSIKEYNIAVDVLDRPNDFDPVTDSIVRVEMHRLRKRLTLFNHSNTKFQLNIPPGTYKTLVTEQSVADEHSAPLIKSHPKLLVPGAILLGLSLLGLSLLRHITGTEETLTCANDRPNLFAVLSEETGNIPALTNHHIRSIMAQYSTAHAAVSRTPSDLNSCNEAPTPLYKLSYEIVTSEETTQTNVLLKLTHANSDRLISSKNINLKTELQELEYDIASFLSDNLKGNGVLASHAKTAQWGNDKAKENHICNLSRYDYFVSSQSEDYLRALNCLEKANVQNYATADSLAGLAELYLLQVRGYEEKTIEDPLQHAKTLIQKAESKNEYSVELLISNMAYAADVEDFNVEELENAIVEMISVAPFNSEILISVANIAGFKAGNWELSKWASDRAHRIHNEQDDSLFYTDAALALMHSPQDGAMAICEKVYSPKTKISNLLILACAGINNDNKWAMKTVQNLQELDLVEADEMIEFIEGRNYDSKYELPFILGIEKGMELADSAAILNQP